jgi:hypothetical protein
MVRVFSCENVNCVKIDPVVNNVTASNLKVLGMVVFIPLKLIKSIGCD